MQWQAPEKPNELTENRLLSAILDGEFPIGSSLPAERELAARLGVTRPTLREALQRLGRDGWLEIRHGKPTKVRDFWQDGNLGMLAAMAGHWQSLPADFVPNLLFIRYLLAPEYARLALANNPAEVLDALAGAEGLADTPEAFAAFDWALHKRLTQASGIAFFVYFINNVQGLYALAGTRYFEDPEARAHSRAFYAELRRCAEGRDAAAGFTLMQRVMFESRSFWLRFYGGQAN